MSLLWMLKFCILTKCPKIEDVKLATYKQFLGVIFVDVFNKFDTILNFWLFIKTLYCKVHSKTTFTSLKKEELIVQTN